MFNRALRTEYVRLGAWLLLWALLGLLVGQLAWALCLGLGFYLGGHLLSIFQLYRWLRNGDHSEMPQGLGIWEEIYREFHRLDKKNTKRKRHLTSIVNQFEASTAALPDAAVVLDSKTRIVWFNEAALSILGLRSPKDLGQRIVNLIRAPEFVSYIESGDVDKDQDVEVPSPVDRDSVLSIRVIPYGIRQQLLIARDISQMKRIEEMRRAFVANASHELRTPLTVLRGYLDMMHEDASKTEHASSLAPWGGPLKDMIQQSTRMEGIVTDLLKLAQLEANSGQGNQSVVDVPDLLRQIQMDAEGLSNGDHQFHFDLDKSLKIYGQDTELLSIFTNLIFNAVQYTPEGGDVTVSWRKDQQSAVFSVQDSGIGIDPRHIPRLTERFYRVDAARSRRKGGTGLGLAIVKHALEHHNAELEIASELNVGSSFTCRFPADRVRLAHSEFAA